MSKRIIPTLSVLVLSVACQLAAASQSLPQGPTLLITDRALDGRGGKLRDAHIRIADGKILALNGATGGAGSARARVVDLRGYTVMPGWIDAHVHIASHFDRTGHLATDKESPGEAELEMAAAAWKTLLAGFTTIQSVGDPSEGPLRDAIRADDLPGPRLLTSLAPIEGNLAATPEALRALVRERKAQGADLIKYSLPTVSAWVPSRPCRRSS